MHQLTMRVLIVVLVVAVTDTLSQTTESYKTTKNPYQTTHGGTLGQTTPRPNIPPEAAIPITEPGCPTNMKRSQCSIGSKLCGSGVTQAPPTYCEDKPFCQCPPDGYSLFDGVCVADSCCDGSCFGKM